MRLHPFPALTPRVGVRDPVELPSPQRCRARWRGASSSGASSKSTRQHSGRETRRWVGLCFLLVRATPPKAIIHHLTVLDTNQGSS